MLPRRWRLAILGFYEGSVATACSLRHNQRWTVCRTDLLVGTLCMLGEAGGVHVTAPVCVQAPRGCLSDHVDGPPAWAAPLAWLAPH